VVSQQRIELRFTIFPLLMAGFSTKDQQEKEEVMILLKTIETHPYGGSRKSARRLLGSIIEKQARAVVQSGTVNSVDLVEEIEKKGFIICGL
jgi:hypothetical protein